VGQLFGQMSGSQLLKKLMELELSNELRFGAQKEMDLLR
jgi:hypothetical protein